jgi:hypothetical protein
MMKQASQPPDLDALNAASIAGRRFGVWRTEDITGQSGTGWVMAGIQFPDGSVATRWVNSPLQIATSTIWPDLESVEKIHGHGGTSQLIWLDLNPSSNGTST